MKMAFTDWIWETPCPECGKLRRLKFKSQWTWKPVTLKCKGCGYEWTLNQEPRMNLPSFVICGPEKLKRIRLVQLPQLKHFPWGSVDEFGNYVQPPELQPYSIRSVVTQLSESEPEIECRLCSFGKVGKLNWEDWCQGSGRCHLVSGWSTGQETCPCWEFISTLCQSDSERQFLHYYLRFAYDISGGDEFPMLIPQVRLATGRIRVDFVAFVPETRWKWHWYAIEIDTPIHHPRDDEVERAEIIRNEGYILKRITPEKKWLDWARELVEDFWLIITSPSRD